MEDELIKIRDMLKSRVNTDLMRIEVIESLMEENFDTIRLPEQGLRILKARSIPAPTRIERAPNSTLEQDILNVLKASDKQLTAKQIQQKFVPNSKQ